MLTFQFRSRNHNTNAKQSSVQTRRITWIILTVVLLSTMTYSCSPGRGGGSRRRSARKLTPLVFKEHVPKLPENTFGASGQSLGRITRNDERFRTLIPNYNPDIIFKDEEGTGADRLMTQQRCRERLDTLSISVMNQWPGVKLRVTEGWDEERHHTESSLHYEGRAVDITTSDRDPSKYGMLARLAVEAGFDWVYYESRSHIHCSVKAESRLSEKTIGCFSGEGTVSTPYGDKLVKDIQTGEKVLVADSDFSPEFSEVILFLHKDDQMTTRFAVIEVDSIIFTTLTVEHLLYVVHEKSDYRIIFARDVRPGQHVFVHVPSESKLSPRVVTDVRFVEMRGVYAPLTKRGNIVVDGVLASCYAEVDSHHLAHWALFPIRALQNLKSFTDSFMHVLHHSQQNISDKPFAETFRNGTGIHWYASFLHRIVTFLLPVEPFTT